MPHGPINGCFHAFWTDVSPYLSVLAPSHLPPRHLSIMRFALLVALSHLRSRKHEAGVSAITLISTIGVTVGVTALIMVLAVMEGFEIDLRDKILGSNAHMVVLQLQNL